VISVIGDLLHLFAFQICVILLGAGFKFFLYHMPDESLKDKTCMSYITLV